MILTVLRRMKRVGRQTMRRLVDRALDLRDDLLGARDPLVPSRRDSRFVGGGDFAALGAHFLDHFVRLGGLRSEHRVLEVGSGIGRMALPLTGYLTPPGEYSGFDIVREGVEWCTRELTLRFPHFRFSLADVRNDHYNPAGRFRAAEYRFPFEAGRFDFVILTSVFTHMLPADQRNYLSEIARVLRPGGRVLATFFLLDDEARSLIGRGRSRLTFAHGGAPAWFEVPEDPEHTVAYDLGGVRAELEAAGLRLDAIHTGSWCGRPSGASFQDIVLATRC